MEVPETSLLTIFLSSTLWLGLVELQLWKACRHRKTSYYSRWLQCTTPPCALSPQICSKISFHLFQQHVSPLNNCVKVGGRWKDCARLKKNIRERRSEGPCCHFTGLATLSQLTGCLTAALEFSRACPFQHIKWKLLRICHQSNQT